MKTAQVTKIMANPQTYTETLEGELLQWSYVEAQSLSPSKSHLRCQIQINLKNKSKSNFFFFFSKKNKLVWLHFETLVIVLKMVTCFKKESVQNQFFFLNSQASHLKSQIKTSSFSQNR